MPSRFDVERAVLASDLPATRKLIMLVLAAWTDNGTAAIRPDNRKSLTEIARAASVGRSTVKRDLDLLEQDGWITRRRPTAEQARSGAKTGYRLLIPAEGRPPHGLGQDMAYPRPPDGLGMTSGNEQPRPPHGPGVGHHVARKAITQQDAHKNLLLEAFEQFWQTYPRKVGKRTAATAYERASKRAATEKIQAGAEAYRDDPNRDRAYTAHPTTWLNRDGWDDDPLPPRDNGTRLSGGTDDDGVMQAWAVQCDYCLQLHPDDQPCPGSQLKGPRP